MSDRGIPDLAYWRGAGGEQWAQHNDFTERMFAPVTAALLAVIAAKRGDRIVDVGCGCGGLARALAEKVGPTGFVLGLDVSATMLGVARKRIPAGAKAEFVEADAATYAFAKGGFDTLASRHGVMFFDDPARAFANLRMALKPGGRLAFSCFRSPRDNPWAMTPLQAAAPFVPPLPKLGPEDPGPFSFADEARVRRILGAAGFAEVALTPVDAEFDIAAGGGIDAAVTNAVEIGPASRVLRGQGPGLRNQVAQALRDTLAPHVRGRSVPLGAAIWIVTAKNP